jgi:iron complex outermembrane receptor protein
MFWDTFQSVQGALILGGTSDTQLMSTFGDVDSTNWSVFGQVELDFAEEWTLIAGLRWSQDDKQLEMNRIYEDVPQGIPPTEVFNVDAVAIPGIDEVDYGDYAARAQLNWKVAEETLLYASYNRGIKGGNWSLDPLGGVLDENLRHDEEVLNAYEIGLKTDLFDGNARLNAAAYYYDYKDYQAFSMFVLTPQVTNSDAESTGGEIELTVSPANGLYFMLGAAFIDSEVEAVPDVFGGTLKAEFPTAPAVSLNALVRYEWPAFGGDLAVQVDGKWNDDQYLDGSNSEVSFEPSYSVWNGRLSFQTGDQRLKVALWARNFTDEEYRVYNLDLGLLGFIEQVYAPPRQLGLTMSYHW